MRVRTFKSVMAVKKINSIFTLLSFGGIVGAGPFSLNYVIGFNLWQTILAISRQLNKHI